jgi:hypothetical protein
MPPTFWLARNIRGGSSNRGSFQLACSDWHTAWSTLLLHNLSYLQEHADKITGDQACKL